MAPLEKGEGLAIVSTWELVEKLQRRFEEWWLGWRGPGAEVTAASGGEGYAWGEKTSLRFTIHVNGETTMLFRGEGFLDQGVPCELRRRRKRTENSPFKYV